MTPSPTRNAELFERANRCIPGGVNSPVRAFRSVGGTPPFIERAAGPHIWDADGKQYIDYVGSWGPAILGHAPRPVIEAVQRAAANGLSFGAPTEAEVVLAEMLVHRLPSIEQVRLVSSGTEATMSAIRLARGFTGRSKIVKFDGCYHGHADSLLVKAGSGLLTFGNPTSAGVPPEFAAHTLVLDYNDAGAVEAAFRQYGDQIACVIVEPVAGNMNLVRPAPGFLQTLREQCTRYGAVLVFDEVMTGFRVGPQGVQGLTGITPDITTLAKVIGGGMPIGAFGGRRDIMAHIAPLGPVYQAGTLSGNPVAVAAGIATLELLAEPGFYERLAAQTGKLVAGLRAAAASAGVPFAADHVGGMFGLYFRDTVPASLADVSAANIPAFNKFFHAALARGVNFAPSAFEAGFVSITHDDEVIARTLAVADEAFAELNPLNPQHTHRETAMAVNLTIPAPESVLPVAGVEIGVTEAGIRKAGRRDLTVFRFAEGTQVAGVFTRNRFCAAPVLVCKEYLAQPLPVRALVINTGNANAGTGEPGLKAARAMSAALAGLLGLDPRQVLPFSTGVILEPLPLDRIEAGLPAAVAKLAPGNWVEAAHGIMTTDTLPKIVSEKIVIGGHAVTFTGISKGAGMIRPNMATMLGFLATDAGIPKALLQRMAPQVADVSFNRITVDGDTSTNDSFIIAATGRGGFKIESENDPLYAEFLAALKSVAARLAQLIVRDAEGGTKFIAITVENAGTQEEALKVAYAVAHSPLVKTAFYASDPNLGRILAAVGYAGIDDLDVAGVNLWLDDVWVAKNGGRNPDYKEEDGQRVMKQAEIAVRISLGRGKVSETVYTCDFSHEYVSINADYRS